MKNYLSPNTYIDSDQNNIREKAAELAKGFHKDLDIAKACYTFVRDEIKHSWDAQRNPVTCKASEVLCHGTGYCYAKSHLLAALLRANKIPAGICYQRLSVEESGPPYCLHALNAVYLHEYGWYRCDARGNKRGVNAEFSPPLESLAFPIQDPEEADLPEIWHEPLPIVTQTLERYSDIAEIHDHLPDIQILQR